MGGDAESANGQTGEARGKCRFGQGPRIQLAALGKPGQVFLVLNRHDPPKLRNVMLIPPLCLRVPVLSGRRATSGREMIPS